MGRDSGDIYTLNGNDWTPIGTISNPYLALVRSSEQIAEWKKQGLSDEKIRELSLKDGVISSVLAPVDVNGVTNLLNNGASKEELIRFAMIAAFGRAASGSSKLSKVTDGSSGSGGQAAKANINIAKDFISKPQSIWGRSADEIANDFRAAGYEINVRQSTRGSGQALIVEVKGHPQISQIQVHPGGGRHEGAYYKVSTTTEGTIKVVDPSTYKPTPGEKAKIVSGG